MSELTPNYVRAIEAAGVAVATVDRVTAERALRGAIQTVDELGPDDAALVIALNDLIRLCVRNSSHALAEPLLLRLIEIKRSKGEDHPEYATVLASLAAVRQALGRHEEAEQLWRQVIAIREQTLAPNHFSLATALEHLADACAARGKFADALESSQRALAIREATLGPEHASLRVSRERIADIELLGGEDILDRAPTSSGSHPRTTPATALAPVTAPVPVPPERPSNPKVGAARPVAQVAPQPATPQAAVPRRPSPAPAAIVPARRSPPPVPAPVKPEAYLSVLQNLKSEIEVEQDKSLVPAVRSRVAALVLLLRQPRAAAIVGVSVISLPLAAWGVAGALRSSELKWIDEKSAVAIAKPDTHAVATLAGAGATTGALDRRRDSIALAIKAGAAAVRANDASTKPAEPLIRLQAARRLNISVESIGMPMPAAATGNEPILRHLDATKDLGGAKTASPIGTPTRARMIGELPTPRYPAQQLRGGAGGNVRVRFDVDTLGRPVMSTFTVISSPLPQLVPPVKEIIPVLRFEPARTPWPENRAMVETVELTFLFAPPTKK